ncbi:MAG TPA: hypothetical protein VKE22_06505 [Haliangiales bacterium]|nr:hypothetical protein [Haliangiales bacterium]
MKGDLWAMFVFLGLIVATTAAALLAERFSISGRSRHAARRAKPTPIAGVRDGATAVVVGRVRFAGRSLEAPLSGRRVCHYAASCDDDTGCAYVYGDYCAVGRSVSERYALDFLVEDGSSTALVRVDSGASFDVTAHPVSRDASSDRVRAFLTRKGESGDSGAWSASEGVIEEGTVVSVYGIGEWEPDPSGDVRFAGYRDAPRRLVLRAPEGLHLYIREIR